MKKFQIFYLKHELTSLEEIQYGDYVNILASFINYVEHQEIFFSRLFYPKTMIFLLKACLVNPFETNSMATTVYVKIFLLSKILFHQEYSKTSLLGPGFFFSPKTNSLEISNF